MIGKMFRSSLFSIAALLAVGTHETPPIPDPMNLPAIKQYRSKFGKGGASGVDRDGKFKPELWIREFMFPNVLAKGPKR